MTAIPPKSEFLLLFCGTDWHCGLSPEEVRTIMTAWMKWSDRLVAEGRCVGRRSLGGEGTIISGRTGRVSDGPFAEAKEAVAGYFHLKVDDMDEAVEIGRECPMLVCGMTVEVRPIPVRCLASELASSSLEDIARFRVAPTEFVGSHVSVGELISH